MCAEFVVLPDATLPPVAWESLPFVEPLMVWHASGRPWLVGRWNPNEVTEVSAGSTRMVVVGSCPATTQRLSALAGRVRTLADVDSVARALPGSFHLFVSLPGQVRVQGTVTGLRRVFYTLLKGTPIAGNRASILALMTQTDVNEEMLATLVACGATPPPLADRSIWSGVHAVPPDHYLALYPGHVRQVRWWRPPEPEQPIDHGAGELRHALDTAVMDRRPARGKLGSDLSGGMDSTALCFLAAQRSPSLLTFRWGEADAGNDDAFYAAQAAAALPDAEHVVVGQRDLPALYDDPANTWVDLDRPYLFTRTSARTVHTAQTLAQHGVRLHLAGHGGDELFASFPGYLHQLLRHHPWIAIRHIRGYRALRRWPIGKTVAALAPGGRIDDWWRAQAQQITDPPVSCRAPQLGWGMMPLRAAAWVTPLGIDVTRRALRRLADSAEPLADDLGQHQFLFALRATTDAYRQLKRFFAEYGVQLEMPYLDDRVVETVLAVRLHERCTPWRYKPLLSEAVRGLVPESVLRRSTKGDFGEDLRVGFRRNLPAILDVFADSMLAARGLIDIDVLRTRLMAPQADNAAVFGLESLLGCETWLRAAVRSAKLRRSNEPATTP